MKKIDSEQITEVSSICTCPACNKEFKKTEWHTYAIRMPNNEMRYTCSWKCFTDIALKDYVPKEIVDNRPEYMKNGFKRK